MGLERELALVGGPFVDVGGPTAKKCLASLLNVDRLERRIINLNVGAVAGVDIIADGSALPFLAGSLGAILAAHLPTHSAKDGSLLRPAILKEAKEKLEEGGLLIVLGFTDEDVEEALDLDFQVVKYKINGNSNGKSWNLIFRKPL